MNYKDLPIFKDITPELEAYLDKLDAELANTEAIKAALSKSNPDEMLIEGADKNGKHTFSLSFNKKTGIYVYQGGKPEKTYSNNPELNFQPLPEEALSSLQENQRRTTYKAKVQAELRNGVEFVDGDKKISIKQTKEGKSEKYTVVETSLKDGKILSKFAMDKNNGAYIAKDYQTGTRYNNCAIGGMSGMVFLPPEKLLKYESQITKTENIAATQQQTREKGNQR